MPQSGSRGQQAPPRLELRLEADSSFAASPPDETFRIDGWARTLKPRSALAVDTPAAPRFLGLLGGE
jgi:hypothetical protein